MKFIEPSVEYCPQETGIKGIWEQIARATRVSYQSQGREGERDKDFVKRVILKPALIKGNLDDLSTCTFDKDKMHGSCLEFGTVYLTIPSIVDLQDNTSVLDMVDFLRYNPHSNTFFIDEYAPIYITTNMRVIIEYDLWPILKYLEEPTKYHERRYTFVCNTDIGVTREANRHRTFSIVEQSTRYCAYDNGKFGGEITYIRPAWRNKEEADEINNIPKDRQLDCLYEFLRNIDREYIDECTGEDLYDFALLVTEMVYMQLRKRNVPAEKCRQVLNLSTKSQVVYCAYKSDWEHFCKLRADNYSGKAHPNIQIIAQKIKDILLHL